MVKGKSETQTPKQKSKPDMDVKHSVSEESKKFGDTSGKLEIKIPELQMSFFVAPGTSSEEIESKRQSYLRRGGVFLFLRDQD